MLYEREVYEVPNVRQMYGSERELSPTYTSERCVMWIIISYIKEKKLF